MRFISGKQGNLHENVNALLTLTSSLIPLCLTSYQTFVPSSYAVHMLQMPSRPFGPGAYLKKHTHRNALNHRKRLRWEQ